MIITTWQAGDFPVCMSSGLMEVLQFIPGFNNNQQIKLSCLITTQQIAVLFLYYSCL